MFSTALTSVRIACLHETGNTILKPIHHGLNPQYGVNSQACNLSSECIYVYLPFYDMQHIELEGSKELLSGSSFAPKQTRDGTAASIDVQS